MLGRALGRDPVGIEMPLPQRQWEHFKLNEAEQRWQEGKRRPRELLRGGDSQTTPAKLSLLNMRGSPWKAGMAPLALWS